MSVGIDGLGGAVAGVRRGHRRPGGAVDGARGEVNDAHMFQGAECPTLCTILHVHKVRGEGCVCLMGDIPVVFYSSITRMQIKMIKLDPCKAWDPI